MNENSEQKTTFCTNCGKPLTPGAQFCRFCGEKVKQPAEEIRAARGEAFSPEPPAMPVRSRSESADRKKKASKPVKIWVILAAAIALIAAVAAIALFRGKTAPLQEPAPVYEPSQTYEPAPTYEQKTIAANSIVSLAVNEDGTVRTSITDDNWILADIAQALESWHDIVALAGGDMAILGLTSDGTVVVNGANDFLNTISTWSDIVSIDLSPYAFSTSFYGLRSDGTVLSCGDNGYGQCDVSAWSDIVDIAAGSWFAVGLRTDGTVVSTIPEAVFDDAASGELLGLEDYKHWTNIKAIGAGYNCIVGLRADGTVLIAGNEEEVSDLDSALSWTDIAAIDVGIEQGAASSFVIGLKSDGTVVRAGEHHISYTYDEYGMDPTAEWRDIVDVCGGSWGFVMGLKSDGTTVSVGEFVGDANGWSGIKRPSRNSPEPEALEALAAVIKNDGFSELTEDDIVVDKENGLVYANNSLFIMFSDTPAPERLLQIADMLGARVVGCCDALDIYEYDLPALKEMSLEEICDYTESLEDQLGDEVIAVSVDVGAEPTSLSVPTDPWEYDTVSVKKNNPNEVDKEAGGPEGWDEENPAGSNWGLEATHVPSAWEYLGDFDPVTVGVVDSGMDTSHKDLKGNVTWIGTPCIDHHGMHVTGIIAAQRDNGVGISGIVPNANVLFSTPESSKFKFISSFRVYAAISNLVHNGAKVVNLSMGFGEETEFGWPWSFFMHLTGKTAGAAIAKLLNESESNDFLIVQAAGNENLDAKDSGMFCAIKEYYKGADREAVLDHCIIVGSIGLEEPGAPYPYHQSDFSNGGSAVDICAPGEDILSCAPSEYDTNNHTIYTNGYCLGSGTSMAAPHVTGIAALVWSANPDLTAAEVKNILISTATEFVPPTTDVQTTLPLVDALSAVRAALGENDDKTPSSPAPAPTPAPQPVSAEKYSDSTGEHVAHIDYVYDADGNLLKRTIQYDYDPLYQRVLEENTYNDKGQLESSKTLSEAEMAYSFSYYSYDEYGNIASVLRELAESEWKSREDYTYDSYGNITSRAMYDGVGELSYSRTLSYYNEYDDEGRLTYTEMEGGSPKTYFTYDNEGRLIQKTMYMGSVTEDHIYEYDELGRLLTERDLLDGAGSDNKDLYVYSYPDEPQTSAVSDPADELGLYGDVLDALASCCRSNWTGTDNVGALGDPTVVHDPCDPDSFSYMFYMPGVDYSLSNVGYSLKDIDGNGVDELLLSLISETEATGIIFDIYTACDGQVIHLTSSGERFRYSLRDDLTIAFSGSSGALESSTEQYTIRSDGAGLELLEGVTYNALDYPDSPWLYMPPGIPKNEYGGYDCADMTPISEAEAKNLQTHILQTMFLPTFTPLSELY